MANEDRFDLCWPPSRYRLYSPQLRDLACHADASNAFVRRRELPLLALVTVMLNGMHKSVLTGLDEFFVRVKGQAQFIHRVSAHAFAKVRAKLSTTAIPALNDCWSRAPMPTVSCRAGTSGGW